MTRTISGRPPESILITVYDLKRLFLRLGPTLKRVALLLFCLSFLSLLLREPKYLAQATFKHLNKQNDYSSFAKELLKEFSSPSSEWPTFSVMHSNEVLKNSIEALGMHIHPSSSFHPFTRAWKTVQSEMGIKPQDPDLFCFRNVSFERENALQFYIRPLNAESYEVLNEDKKVIASGELTKPICIPQCTFTLLYFPHNVKEKALYGFKVIPWTTVLESVRKQFEVKEHRLDANVFHLYFAHKDRALAAQFLNQVMQCYQEYYQRENEEIYDVQVSYLAHRQNELISQYDSALKEHTGYLRQNIGDAGCMEFTSELTACAEPHRAFQAKLFDIDLELKRLQSLYPHATPLMHVHSEALSLSSAKALYQQYIEKRDQIEAQLRQHRFLRETISTPDFELSSLSSFLTDPVSLSLAQNASAIALKIKDGENRTTKEQERLKEELDTQKRFLHQHLAYMIDLGQSQLTLLSQKIQHLQLQTKSLLEEEKQLLQDKIAELKEKMASLPEKWHRENLLLLKKELGASMIAAMTQLVESKNLNQKLYQVASKHLDLSIPPLRPLRPHLILYSLLTAFVGCFLYYVYKLCESLLIGFPVSHANLHYGGFNSLGLFSPHCNGALKELNDRDIETVRTVSHFLTALPPHSCSALLLGKNPDYSRSLCELLSLAEYKVLLVHATFDVVKKEDVPGMWHYLHGEIKEAPIRHGLQFDELPCGGTSRFGIDMLALPRCTALLSELKQKYDIVLLRTHIRPESSEAQSVSKIVNALIVSACDESIESLSHYRDIAEKKEGPALRFVCF